MIKILKSGFLKEPLGNQKFVCTHCGCKFITDQYENNISIEDTFRIVTHCPECQHIIYQRYKKGIL